MKKTPPHNSSLLAPRPLTFFILVSFLVGSILTTYRPLRNAIFLTDIHAQGASKSTVNGKYNGLIQKIHCPSDKNSYGNFSDYGYYQGGSWCGQQTKAGYWVYVHPYWYIYKNSKKPSESKGGGGKGGGIEKVASIEDIIKNDPYPLNRHKLNTFPSFFGQYGTLLEKFKCAKNPTTLRKKFSHWGDLGFRQNYKTKCNNHRLKNGYIVFVKPYYYSWKKKLKNADPMVIASAGGYYKQLIKTRSGITSDSLYGGRVFEEGYSDLTYYPGYGKMTPGFRVLFDGKWYTWKEVNIPHRTMAKQIKEASNNGKYNGLLQIIYCPYLADWSGRRNYSKYKFEQREILCGGYKAGNKIPYYKTYIAPYLYLWQDCECR